MDENLLKAKVLLKKYNEGTCTPEEKAWVETWYGQLNTQPTDLEDYELEEDLIELKARLDSITENSERRGLAIKVAAAIFIFFSVGISIYWFSTKDNEQTQQFISKYGEDVLPGGNRALLTLADGRTIDLDSAANGLLAQQQGINISKSDDGTITYEMQSGDGKSPAAQAGFNTIATPRGGQYKVILPDGSTVWLNAASSLRYPTAFRAGERKVELTGEGYFEVAHDERHPFIVESKEQSVQVLGTSFNINAYADEDVVATTLVNGSVKLYHSRSDGEQLLQPGEQAVLRGKVFQIQQVDVGDYTSWKSGLIVLNDASLFAIIRQIERWYDVEFILPEISTSRKVFGELRRDINLSEILDALHEYYGLNFKMEGRRIIVSK